MSIKGFEVLLGSEYVYSLALFLVSKAYAHGLSFIDNVLGQLMTASLSPPNMILFC